MAMDDIIKAALEERWDYVDSRISEFCNNRDFQERAINLLESDNPNLKDLGASIIAKSKIDSERYLEIREKLGLMLSDKHPYVRYRAAFALAEHGAGDYDCKMREVLIEARGDKEVGEIAQGYLERIEK